MPIKINQRRPQIARIKRKKSHALDAAILRGLADGAAGRTTPADEVFDELKARYTAMAEARRPR